MSDEQLHGGAGRLTQEDRRLLRIITRGPVHDCQRNPLNAIAYMMRRGWLTKTREYDELGSYRRWGRTRQYEATPLAFSLSAPALRTSTGGEG